MSKRGTLCARNDGSIRLNGGSGVFGLYLLMKRLLRYVLRSTRCIKSFGRHIMACWNTSGRGSRWSHSGTASWWPCITQEWRTGNASLAHASTRRPIAEARNVCKSMRHPKAHDGRSLLCDCERGPTVTVKSWNFREFLWASTTFIRVQGMLCLFALQLGTIVGEYGRLAGFLGTVLPALITANQSYLG